MQCIQSLHRPTKVSEATAAAAAFASIIYKTLSGRSQRPRRPSDTKGPSLTPNCQAWLPMANLMARTNYSVNPSDRRPNAGHLQSGFKSLMRWLVQFATPTYFAYFCAPVMFQRKCKSFGYFTESHFSTFWTNSFHEISYPLKLPFVKTNRR